MPIIKKTIWIARCDECKKEFGENALFPFAETRRQLLEGFDEALWKIKKEKVLCDECSYEGEDDGIPF